jgi:hypothetical protein
LSHYYILLCFCTPQRGSIRTLPFYADAQGQVYFAAEGRVPAGAAASRLRTARHLLLTASGARVMAPAGCIEVVLY